MNRILAVNPGATSTKFAVFDDAQPILQHSVEHHGSELQRFARVADQADFRLALITAALDAASIPLASLQAVVGRGGLLKPLSGGTYGVNRAMLDDLHAATRGEHASNLGAIIAGNVIDAGANACVLHRTQYLAITLTSDDCAQDLLACLADYVGDDVSELNVHLGQGLLHMLDMAPLAAQ